MTYKQAYDKIIDAYFKDEIKPMDGKFCFCGTLCNQSSNWMGTKPNGSYKSYSFQNLKEMEDALLTPFDELYKEVNFHALGNWNGGINVYHRDFEEKLFSGMCAALEVLKQIHIDRGEVIDPLPTFTKRVFSDVLKMVK